MKYLLSLILVLGLIYLIGCGTASSVDNPPFTWDTYPDTAHAGDYNVPRNRVYQPGGTGTKPDDGKPKEGKPTGEVAFGPGHTTGSGLGHPDSRAVKEFVCGDGSKCKVRLSVGALVNLTGPNEKGKGEFLVITLQGLDSRGNPVGTADKKEIEGNSGSNPDVVLEIDRCGRVRLTLSVREVAGNAPGIETPFSAHVYRYECK